jgi:hypothetical protein
MVPLQLTRFDPGEGFEVPIARLSLQDIRTLHAVESWLAQMATLAPAGKQVIRQRLMRALARFESPALNCP